jgi:hypothetical protein
VETYRTYSQISPEEVVTDMNTLNLKISTLEFNPSIMEFGRDTTVFLSKSAFKKREADLKAQSESEIMSEESAPIDNNISTYYYYPVDSIKKILSGNDSIEQINDSVFVLLSAPNLDFISEGQWSLISQVNLVGNNELYHSARMARAKGIDSKQYFQDIVKLLRKYERGWSDVDLYRKMYRKDIRIESFGEISTKYDVYPVNSKIGNISTIMTRWLPDDLMLYLHITVFLSVCLSLLVYLYRHTTLVAFFLTFLVGFLLYILSALVLIISRYHNDEGTIYMICIGFFLLFAGLGISNLWARKRSMVKGIALNLFLLTFQFLPLLLTMIYYHYLEKKYSHLSYSSDEYQRLFEDKNSHLLLSGWLGLFLLLVAIEFCFKKLYVKWYALPQE